MPNIEINRATPLYISIFITQHQRMHSTKPLKDALY